MHRCVFVMTKTVSLDEEAYERLAARKERGESFSDVVKRLAGERSLLEIAGIWEDEELRGNVEETRREMEERLDGVARSLK